MKAGLTVVVAVASAAVNTHVKVETVNFGEDLLDTEKNITETSAWKSEDQGKKALVIVDLQASFLMPEGSLPVSNSEELPNKIIELIEWDKKNKFFDHIVLSKDYHDVEHIGNARAHEGKIPKTEAAGPHDVNAEAVVHCRMLRGKTFKDDNIENDLTDANNLEGCCSETWKFNQSGRCEECTTEEKNTETCKTFSLDLWPDHCLKDGLTSVEENDTKATIPESVLDVIEKAKKNKKVKDITIEKGEKQDRETYSIFADAGTNMLNGTNEKLRELGITKLYFTGLATDYCVGRSALHALGANARARLQKDDKFSTMTINITPYEVFMFEDLMKGIFPHTTQKMMNRIDTAGGKLIKSWKNFMSAYEGKEE